MKPAADLHPSPDCLRLFGTGQLSADEAASVEAHVSDCPDCGGALRSVADDPFVELVRRATSAHPAARSGDTTPQFASRLPGGICADSTSPDAQPVAPAIVEVPAELREHPRYRVLGLLGHGGMGTVYKAEHRLMQRTVALKLIARNLTTRPEVAERFVRETQTAGRLAHANIAQAFDAEQAGDTLFLVMEFVPGTDLARLVRERGPLPCAEGCRYVRQAALALQHAHERGMVHRDIKPHNLMLTPGGEIKVLDFGLARFVLGQPLADTSHLTEEGLFMGTADYVAPEQARDAHQADIRADVYSLGCTLYHLLTGRVPFPAGSVMDKVIKHATEQAAALSALRPDLPAGLEGVVMKMMAKLPDQRYQTPGEVAEALAPFATAAVTVIPLVQPVRLRRTGPLIEAELVREPAASLSQTAVLPAGAGWSGRERWWRRLVAVAAGLLFVATALAGVVVYRIQTDRGELVITTESNDVEVVVKQGGKVVRIIDTKTDKSVTLRSGVYELELKGAPEGLQLDIKEATLTRGKTVLAKIKREPKEPPVTADPPIIHPLHRIRWPEGSFSSFLRDIDLSPDNRYVAAIRLYDAPRPPHRRLRQVARMWHLETGQFFRELPDTEIARFTPDGKQVLSMSSELNFTLREVATGEVVRQFGDGLPGGGLELSASGTRGRAAVQDDSIRLFKITVYDWAAGKELCRIDRNREDGWLLTPDGRHLLRYSSQAGGHLLGVYDASTGKEVNAYQQLRDVSGIISMSRNGKSLLCREGHNLKVYDVGSGKEIGSFDAGSSPEGSLSGDGRRLLATADYRSTLNVWDVTARRVIARLRFREPLEGGPAWFNRVHWRFSADGQWAAFTGPTDSVYVFRIPLEAKAKDR
jgi:WD40 repeat protein